LDELELLVLRYGNAIGPDLAALTMAELWGLYLFLRALAEKGG
jgi:hypothetical protein